MLQRAGRAEALVYIVEAAGGVVRLQRAKVSLGDAEIRSGVLSGPDATVESRCVLVDSDANGDLHGHPMEPLEQRSGGFCFDPSGGGVRGRQNRLASGAWNAAIAESARFGMVNSFFHTNLVAGYLNGLLSDVGAPSLPPLHVVVSAHSGSPLRVLLP